MEPNTGNNSENRNDRPRQDQGVERLASGLHIVPAADDFGLRYIISAIVRNRMLAFGIIGLFVAVGVAFILFVDPLYEAETLILIEPREPHLAAIEPIVATLQGDLETVRSERYILTSSEIARRVIVKLGLADDPEFNTAVGTESGIDAARSAAARILRTDSKLVKRAGVDMSHLDTALLVDRFHESLRVDVVANSRVISISFRSRVPAKAQEIANAIAAEYLQVREEIRVESSGQLTEWLDQQVAELRDRVRGGEEAIETLRQKFGIVDGAHGDLASEELALISTQLIMTRAERGAAEARLEQARLLLGSADQLRASSDVLDSTLIQRLRTEEIALQAQLAELSSELGNQHPRMSQLRAEVNELQSKIDLEIQNIIASLENQYNIARARERSVEADLARLKSRVAELNEKEIEIRSLEREVEANRALLGNLLRQHKEAATQVQSGFLQADVRVISQALMPTTVAFPNRKIVLGLSVFASLIFGGMVILLREMLENGYRSVEELEADTEVRSLGFIPRANHRGRNLDEIDLLKRFPDSAFAESIRTLLWSVNLACSGSDPQVIAVTSAIVGEGKSTLVNSLCSSLLRADKSVVVIDADLRKPSIDKRWLLTRTPGLVDYLAEEASLEEIVRRIKADTTGTSGFEREASVITAGRCPVDVLSLLSSGRMGQLLDDLREDHDFILIDTPPILIGADAQLMARLADATILCVRWRTTPRRTVKFAIKQLETAQSTTTGTVLTAVDVKQYSYYEYGDSGKYAGKLAEYYGRA